MPDTKSLNNSLDLIEQSLNSNGLEAKRLNNKELAVFLKYSYDKDFDEHDFDTYEEKDYIKKVKPESVQFNILSTKQNNKTLTHFVITDFPLMLKMDGGKHCLIFQTRKLF